LLRKSRLLPAGWEALKFTRKRRILIKQTNLSFGFAFSALRSTRRNEWAKAHFSFGRDTARLADWPDPNFLPRCIGQSAHVDV
jgi:hypothetical protein